MYVCICNAITDKQIRQAARTGARRFSDLQQRLGVASGCGSCKEVATEILNESRGTPKFAKPRIYQPAIA